MTSLAVQDVFEPYYEGRKKTFATIDPSAVERAKKLKERLEELRKAASETHDEAA